MCVCIYIHVCVNPNNIWISYIYIYIYILPIYIYIYIYCFCICAGSAPDMSKGAVVQMTRSLALEYVETPIRINAVSPGAMATEIGESAPMPEGLDMNKVARYSGLRPPTDASEVAALVAFVASSKASAIHGAILCADGATTTG